MKRISTIMALVLVSAFVLAIAPASAGAQAKPLVVYMQMGGDKGAPSVLARTNGAEAACKALGIDLHEQYAGWDSGKMIGQVTQTIDATPDSIVILGNPRE